MIRIYFQGTECYNYKNTKYEHIFNINLQKLIGIFEVMNALVILKHEIYNMSISLKTQKNNEINETLLN